MRRCGFSPEKAERCGLSVRHLPMLRIGPNPTSLAAVTSIATKAPAEPAGAITVASLNHRTIVDARAIVRPAG